MAAGALIRAIPEFTAAGSVKITPNASVPATDRLLRLIDARAFQRLRRIRQLSLADQVFPSATHTRFSHALGVYANILDYLRRLDQFPEFHRHFSEEDYLGVMLAGLLHDLGHYPCSHQLEHFPFFPEHERLTIALIRGEMKYAGEDLGALIRELFGVDPECVVRFLDPDRKLDPPLSLLQQIIDSPVDADKCDYLPRDSYHCGLDSGIGFDRQRFIASLRPSRDGRLCIHEKGLVDAERFQLARYWLYRSVYWGHTVRALITMLSSACRYIRREEREKDWSATLLAFNDHNFMEWLHDVVEGPGQEVIDLVWDQRQPYKRVYTVARHRDPDVYQRLQDAECRDAVVAWFHEWAAGRGLEIAPHHLLWDAPPVYKDKSWESFPIKLESGEEAPIARESPVIEALSQAFLFGVRKIRLFCHPRLAAEIRGCDDEIPDLRSLV